MAFSEVIRRTWRENILFSALVELTYRCNLDCFFCYNDTQLKGIALSFDEYRRFFEDLRDMGTMNLSLTGGEPLAHPEFFALGRLAKELGFLVRVKTNGHALRGKILHRMREEVDPFMLDISLHGASAETHDRQTRVPGSFDRLLANVRDALALGLRIRLNSPLTLWNEHEVEAMHRLVDELGVLSQFDPMITRRDDGDPGPFQISPSPAGIKRLFEVQRDRAEASRRALGPTGPEQAQPIVEAPAIGGEKVCGAGSAGVTVDPYGNVYPCVQWRRPIGNLHDHSIRALWTQSDELTEVRRLAAAAKQTVDRAGTPGFFFCPGSAERETGNATSFSPAAKVVLDMRKRVPVGATTK